MGNNINFKLKINNQFINHYDKIDKSFIFTIDGIGYSMKQISKKCEIIVICDKCYREVNIKSIQPLILRNKIFLCKSCRSLGELNSMYGKKHKETTLIKLSENNRGEKNGFYGKKHSDDTKKRQKEVKIGKYDGENNPMYGKSLLNVWLEKYGEIVANEKMEEYKKLQHKISSGKNNAMYGKNYLDIWIKKYGETISFEKFNEHKEKLKTLIRKRYEDDPTIKDKISNKLKNREFTDKHRQNLRISQINYINKKLTLNGGKMVPHFNIFACELFDKIAKLKNITIKHALNGGEYFIPELGYWVDGYDEINNVVYEYYEKEHKLRVKKDLIRQNQIQEFLNCEFIIINEGQELKFLNDEI